MRKRRNGHGLTRRDLLAGTVYATMATVLGGETTAGEKTKSDVRSRVVLVRHPDALDKDHKPNHEVIQDMVDRGVKTLLGIDDTVEAWRQIVRPDDVVGIKTNVWMYMPTPKAVENAIWRRMVELGVSEDRIRLDDRGVRQSLADCTALINTRPLRTHHWSGIGGCLKNYIMFVKSPWHYHSNACADLGKIWTLPIVRDKTRLNILVVLRPLFHGRGPHHYNPKYVWDYKGLLVSSDPVACDAVGVALLSAKRGDHFGEDTPFPKRTHHVTFAEVKYHVGVADPNRIDLIKAGWTEGALI